MKKVLVVIDLQNDFVDGSLGTKEAVEIVDRVAGKIKSYQGETVFATRDTHGEDYLTTLEGKHLPVVHCVKGTKGWEICPKVKEALSVVQAEIIDKPTFGSEKLADILYGMAQKEEIAIELIGLCTDICVVSNALLFKARMPETEIRVDAACCAGVTQESHEAALLTMKMCQIG